MLVTLLYSIAGGTLLMLAAARVEQIAWPFLRLLGILSLALTAGPTVWLLRESSEAAGWSATFGALGAFGATLLILLSPLAASTAAGFRAVAAIAGVSVLAAACWDAPWWTMVVGQVAGALLLGSITSAWLLGHAYLTATSMTIEPLRRFSRVLLWTVAARAAFLVVSLTVACVVQGGAGSILHRLADSWLIVSLRVGVGLVGVGVFAYLVADCVRLRATQSATGILYFGSVMAYVGELASLQLTRELGWAI